MTVSTHSAPPSPVTVLIDPSSTGTLTAGHTYNLTCIALKSVNGLTQPALTEWTGSSGAAVETGNNILLGSAVSESLRTVQRVTFSPLATSHAGVYSCQSTLHSDALTTPDTAVQSYTVTVSGKHLH